jgi:8-oxo-dGTP pyrophosphatase MutT (NUDIX family)
MGPAFDTARSLSDPAPLERGPTTVHRQSLLDLLHGYELRHPAERACVRRIRELVRNHSDCFERSCLPGHVTASSWIVSSDRERFLLTHHRKLDRWLQLGGHADGEPDVFSVALREAREESGMQGFDWLGDAAPHARPVPIDVDVHPIPARPGEPAHEHHDIRFLLVAHPEQELRISPESKALRWFAWDRLEDHLEEESLVRLGRKARDLLGR